MTQLELPFRIGHGFDVHRFKQGDSIMLGGVKIPHTHAFEAHSDGDVLIHSICDALLGAIAAGDIGQHFPDTDEAYKNIDSCVLLAKVNTMVAETGYKLGNLDVTVIAQAPRLAAFILPIRERLAAELNFDISQINVKATTTEKLGYIGREEGIAVHSVVLLAKQ
jgi:2-C-methyl-D-erythritol 2,4-cyclodiphosphate synthase